VPTIDGRVTVDVSLHALARHGRARERLHLDHVPRRGGLFAAILRKNPRAEVTPFHEKVVDVRLEPRDSVLSNAARLAALPSGGTSCSAPLQRLNRRRTRGDLVVYLSDNESWVDAAAGRGTAVLEQWGAFRLRNPSARMVCVDLQPNRTTQAAERKDVLNVGGFSDTVFDLVADFAAGRLAPEAWVAAIHAVPPASRRRGDCARRGAPAAPGASSALFPPVDGRRSNAGGTQCSNAGSPPRRRCASPVGCSRHLVDRRPSPSVPSPGMPTGLHPRECSRKRPPFRVSSPLVPGRHRFPSGANAGGGPSRRFEPGRRHSTAP
jgi:hypothetical protein